MDQNVIVIGKNGRESYCHRQKKNMNLIVKGEKGAKILLS